MLMRIVRTISRCAPLLALAALASCSSSSKEPKISSVPSGASKLELVREQKLSTLIASPLAHLEASGVTRLGDALYVVFDNTEQIGVVDLGLTNGSLLPGAPVDSQYEGIANDGASRLWVVEEMDGDKRARIFATDPSASGVTSEATDVAFSGKKGIEGIAWVATASGEYLLAQCEGNFCADDDTKPGNGRIFVLRVDGGAWTTQARLDVPAAALFADYSDLALRARGDGSYTVAIVSQESSALWIGTLSTSPWALYGPGAVYAFPRDANGDVAYCTIEGVSFLDATTLVMVSDKAGDGDACAAKSEAIHVFTVPAPDGG
jgi:hypothetical protein